MSDPHQIFQDYLIKTEGRYTSQKKNICSEIFEMSSHFEVDQFLLNLDKKNLPYSRATVYRVIKQLLDAGLLQKITTLDGKVFYESNISEDHHDHLICNDCGTILEIKDKKLEKMLKGYCKNMDFSIEYRSLHIYGKCQSCSVSK